MFNLLSFPSIHLLHDGSRIILLLSSSKIPGDVGAIKLKGMKATSHEGEGIVGVFINDLEIFIPRLLYELEKG